jgi:tRNA nucleotidyltransferase/poly(A) polymerase
MRPDPDEQDDLAAYAGRWVAVIGNRVVGQGGTPDQAQQAAKSTRSKEVPQIRYIALRSPVTISPWVEQVSNILSINTPVYLVGGALRDALLNKDSHDLDFVLPEKAVWAARRVADQLKGAFYILDEERQTARVILQPKPGERLLLDFALQRGPDLESDLRARDFSINAIAINIRQPDTLLDPLGGAADLLGRKLRACSPDAFYYDPVRILRAVRIASAYQLNIVAETRQWMRQAVKGLENVSPERLCDELFRIFSGPHPALVIRALDLLDALQPILPEIAGLKGISQSPPHTADVFRHALDTVRRLEQLLQVLAPVFEKEITDNLMMGMVSLKLGRYRQQLNEHLDTSLTPDRSVRPLLFMAALYHDTGKANTYQVDPQGQIRFLGHEKLGEQIASLRAKNLHLSTAEVDRLSRIVSNHMRPLWLAHQRNKVSARAVYRFFRDTGAAGVDICLLALADLLSTYGTGLPQELWEQQLEVTQALLSGWWEHPQEMISPAKLIDGNDLMREFELKAGPQIGRLLEEIREAQVSGEVSTPQQAIDLARKILANKIS